MTEHEQHDESQNATAESSGGDRDEGRREMEEFESQEELPHDLEKWPKGKGKFVTFADDDDAPYGEGKTAKLGPPLVYHEDGSVTVDGEKVDNPEDYKGEPIPLAVEIDLAQSEGGRGDDDTGDGENAQERSQ